MLTKCFIIGNVVRKPELKMGKSGVEFCNFSVATREKKDVPPIFWSVDAFSSSAKFAVDWLDKGSLVLVEGSLKMDVWEKDGQKRERIKISASNVRSLGRKEDSKETQPTLEETKAFGNIDWSSPHSKPKDFTTPF